MKVPVRTSNLDLGFGGSTISYEYELEDWTSDGNGGDAYYAISTYIILKSNSEIFPAIVND